MKLLPGDQLGTTAMTNDHLAWVVQQNWMRTNPLAEARIRGDVESLDDSLTSLNWLHSLNVAVTSSTPMTSPHQGVDSQSVIHGTHPAKDGSLLHITSPTHKQTSFPNNADLKAPSSAKPPYSYAALICMAMRASKLQKLTLSSIYNWIAETFPYYQLSDPSWQNSIRHNLSLNKCFQKVTRQKDEPGKGGFWQINPEYSQLLEHNIFKRRSEDEIPNTEDQGNSGNSRKRKKRVIDETTEATLALQNSLVGYEDNDQDEDQCGSSKYLSNGIPNVSLSPIDSENNSDEVSDLLDTNLAHLRQNTEESDHNLSINGMKIEPPCWWSESLMGNSFNGLLNGSASSAILSNPISLSASNTIQLNSNESHSWSASKLDIEDTIAVLDDMDKFFNVQGPLL